MEAITDYKPAVNNFTDWNDTELANLKGLKVLNKTENRRLLTSSKRLGAPSELDWRNSDGVTAVQDQGSCGSCWAFATVAYSESKVVLDGRYSVDFNGLSEQRLLECTTDSSCNGGYLEYAMEEATNEIPFRALYPYDPYTTHSGICSMVGVQVGETVENYYNLEQSELIDLVVDRPIAISVYAEDWQYYGSGIFSCDATKQATGTVNHAVLLVGYTSDYWIIKNSWGSSWGESGFIRVTRNPVSDCKIGRSAHRTFELHHILSFILTAALVLILL